MLKIKNVNRGCTIYCTDESLIQQIGRRVRIFGNKVWEI